MFTPLFCVCVFRLISGQDDGPIVDTEYGPVQGRSVYVDTYDVTVNSFHAIYYAQAPINELRFAAPEPPEPWTEVRDATTPGPACVQNGSLNWDSFSEDCLHLDVVTPSATSGAPYPVMVWIHGGGFQTGANVEYFGHFLAAKDVVVVIINYRLGNLGFLYSGDSAIPGNAGMLDQVMALQWVQDNIANFGGDPDLVTIFGESAGGASVGLHIVSPLSSGLFGGAILESGTELNPWATSHPALTEQQNYTLEVANMLDCPTDDSVAMATCLREVDAETLYNAKPPCAGFSCPGDKPVIDGAGGFLPDTPFDLRNRGSYNNVPEIVLQMSEDGSFFHWAESENSPDMPGNITAGYTREEFLQIIDYKVERDMPGLSEELQDEIKAALNFMYTPWPYINNRELNRAQIGYIYTDSLFAFGSDAQAKTQSLENTVYQMVYGYASDSLTSFPDYLGAYHTLDIISVFGYPYLKFNPEVVNDTVLEPDDYNDLDREYAEFIMTMWTNFAKVRNPTPDPVKPPMNWPEVTWEPMTEDSNSYMWLDNSTVEMRTDYKQKEYTFWFEYLRCKILGDQAHVPGFTSCESPLVMEKNSNNL